MTNLEPLNAAAHASLHLSYHIDFLAVLPGHDLYIFVFYSLNFI